MARGGGGVIAFATYDQAPEGMQDDQLAADRIAARCGAAVEPVVWNAPSVAWGEYTAVLVRSTWDYHRCADAFVAWATAVEATGTPLWNPASVIRWNADKRYLTEIEGAGVPIVPTEWIARGGEAELGSVVERRGWHEVVVKPSVGATSYRTYRARAADIADLADLLRTVAADSDALVQPFMPEVGRDGEWSFVFFDDGAGALAYSHAVLKRPRHGDFRVQPEFGGSVCLEEPPAGVVEAARESASILARVAPGPLLYARLDGVVSDGTHAPAGTFLLMEAELIEPLLFFGESDAASDRFAEALARKLAPHRAVTP
jgi:glutathione synthase/RimK-type ligase-like ATP-grasp enzyme